MIVVVLALLQTALGVEARQAPLDHYEWMAVAPIVVGATSLGENGKFVEIEITHRIRGDVKVGAMLSIDVKHTNRNRSRTVNPRGLRLLEGDSFLLLLSPSPEHKSRKHSYRVVRGVAGARELPLEGADAVVQPLQVLAAIQDLDDDGRRWDEMWRLFEEDSPLLIETSLAQSIKFSRVRADHLDVVRPLLEHPEADIRRRTAEIIRLIVKRTGAQNLEDGASVRNELVSTARRDPAIDVRAAATEALSVFDGSVIDDILREIAETDPEQMVRYIAQKALIERRPGS